MRQLRKFALPLIVFLAFSKFPAASRAEPLTSTIIQNVPHIQQKPDFCGEACAAMWLQKLGHSINQDDVFNQAELDPQLGRGCYTKELTVALRNIGFQTGKVWQTIPASQASRDLHQAFQALHTDLQAGIPSIVCMHYDAQPNTTEHFRLITGYDAKADEVIYQEPATPAGSDQRMQRTKFLQLWPLKYDPQQWTVIRLRLASKVIKQPLRKHRFTAADYAQHIMQLKRRLPHKDFHIVLEKPFVVIGDEPPKTVEQRSERTVKWSVDRLKKDFFTRDPDQIIDIWLFRDKASYEKHTQAIFDITPSTPYGFYSSRHRALIMNISTGGGTLVHEIVHPFMAANFRTCPSWFNEGLASLYEQCRDQDGHIWGSTNWRLSGLQRAIRQDRVPTFQTLCETSTHEFYKEDPGTNYAQARYLCYYLQNHGLLVKYYDAFRRNAANDPSGYQTLQQVLQTQDMKRFQADWHKYTLQLQF
ncbi:MAG: hypothetical protein CL681_10165 [Blastopirellula sp.]|nr:hypothetical protein [Blastopirellula sp.]